jgi:hypothetical protein
MPPPILPIPPYCYCVSKYSLGFFIAPLGSAWSMPAFWPTTLAALTTVVFSVLTTEKIDDEVEESCCVELPILWSPPMPPMLPLPGPSSWFWLPPYGL